MKNEVVDLTDQQQLPVLFKENVFVIIEQGKILLKIKESMAKLNAMKKIADSKIEAAEKAMLPLMDDGNKIELDELVISKSIGWSTVVKDESKLPKECFTSKVVKSVVAAKVKELILDGTIDKSVAFMQKSEGIKIK